MGKYTRGLLAVILAVVLVLPAAAFAMLPEANARSSTGMDGPEATKIVDHDTSNHWKFWAGGYDGSKVTTQNVGRIWTDKTVQAIDDGKSDFLTTLSAMSSTSDTTSLVSKPLDIVMVLDASGSMDDPMGGKGSPKRIVALKNAANHFIDTIAEQNKNVKDASKQHQVAIVKFAGKKSDKVGNDTYRDDGNTYNYSQTMLGLTVCKDGGAKSLKNTVNLIEPAGSTRADYGMDLAKGIAGREDAQKIVVFFTDGSPTSSNGFEAEVAKDAINIAKTIKSGGATIYTIGIFNGAKPGDDPTSSRTSNENKFMHAVSSNYPDATSSVSHGFFGTEEWNVNFGNPVAGASYYKSATNAAELDQVFKDISSAITSGKGFPTKVEGNNSNGSGYITFEDELGAFMQVDSFTGAEYNGKTYGAATKSTDGNIDTYTFDGELAHLVITVDRADENNPQRGDIVTVKVPASLIPLRRFTVDESAGTFVVDSTDAISPIRVAYASSVKAIARKNLFTPNNVPGLQDYINEHKDADSNTVSFYANKWTGDDAGDTVASFEPAAMNSYYYFQKLTPVYTDAACTKLATEKPSGSKTYWYKDEFMAQNSSGAPYDDSVSIPVKGSELENFEGALVKDGDHWSIKAGTARLAFINQLHTTKERVGGNPTGTARDVINPQWNNTKVVSGATKVNVYLGNNGKISFTLNTTPTTLTTADFGLTKVLEGRDWTDEDKFEFGLTSEDNAPMPRSTTAFATKGHADISFGEIAYDKLGTYVYKVSEKHAGTTVDGIAYSKNVAEFTVTVTPNAKGKLEASVKKTSGEVEFKNTYTANPAESSVTDQITVTKVLTGHKLQDNEFSFELVEGEDEDASVVETVKNDANGNVAFSAIKYTEIGQHIYTLREVKGNAGGIAYDKTVYTVVTTIADNGKGQLVATHKLKGAEDVKKIEFKNSYTVTPKSSSVTDQITATKSLTGRKLAAGEFSFELVEGDKVVATGTNDASGNITMGTVKYDKAGTHTYTLREVNGGTTSKGIAYDGKTYIIVTTITDKGDGTLKAEHVLKDAKAAEFKNSYNLTPTESSVTDQVKATKFLTGRALAAGEFSFELVEGDKVVATGTNDASGNITMGAVKYTEAGKHTYTLREAKGGTTSKGVSYDAKTYTVVTTVTDRGDGTLAVKHELKDAGTAEFKNSYTVTPEDSSVTDQVTATKFLDGRDLKAGEFRFELVEGSNVVATGTNNADGKIVMDPVTYTAAGEHIYTLRETKAGATENGITYSAAEYTIVTTVTDNGDGTLSVEHKLQNDEKATFENAYTVTPKSSSVTDQITATKVLTGRDLKEGEFSFELVEGDKVVATGKNAADGKITMGEIAYNEPGKHTYTLREVPGDAGNGITYDGKTYTIETTVTDNGKGELVVKHELNGADEAKFNNGYKPNPDEFSVTDQITANKVLTGRELAAGEFSFELVEGEGEDAKVVATGKNAADGKITMSTIEYTKAGTHTYTLREVKGNAGGITYSDAKFTIETTITDKGDGTLEAKHVLKGTVPAEFKNSYSVTPIDAELDFDLSKAINGRDWTDVDKFSFTVTAPEGTPLPDPATVTVSKKDAKDGIAAIKFGKIHYTAAGTYKYEIRENAGSAAGMTYDAHVATAEVTVTDNGKGVLIANVTKKESGRFTNTYRTGLDYAAAGGLKLSKSLSGRPMTEGQFTFTVKPADEASANALGLLPGVNNFKSPATAEATVGLIDILAGHEVKFTQADAGKTFTYTVAEKNDGKPGYTYDDAVRTVTIAVADDGAGTLTATTTVSGGPEGTHTTVHKSGENKVESALVPFHNSYSATTNTPGGTAAQVVATKTLTGRPMADGEFWFGIVYQGELVGYENLKPNIGGHVSFDALHYDTEMLANLEAAGLAHRTDKDGKLAWTINYTAYEDLFGLPNGVSATTWSFGFKVIVVDNGDGTLTATVDYGGVEPLFENVYGAEAVDAALIGTKKLQAAEGLTPADIAGKFTFTVTADEASAPMPERTTATNDAAGNVDFGKIHFTLEDLNRALGVTDDATDKAEADEADEAEADEAEVDADAADTDESNDEPEPAAPTAPRSHTFTYTVTESGSAPGVTNDTNATRKVSYTVSDDGAGHLSVKREGDDGAAFTFTNTYGVAPADSSVTDQVKTVKRLTGRDLAAGEFTFELLEDDVVVANGTNDANGTVTLSPIRYEAPGTHTYTLREACPNALGLYKGVTYDSATYTVVTTVSDNGDGTLTATHKLEGTTESAGFTNKYHAMPTQVSIGAIKVLEGRELKKDEFSFKLVGEDIESTVTNDADGKINFDKFEYDEPGTHAYTISEVKGDEVGMTYDKSVFTVTVNVVDDGEGNLKANVAFTKGDKSVEGIVFNNTYKKPETPVPTPDPGTPKTVTNIVKTVKGFLPTTGDQQAAALLMAFVIAMAGVGALVWGIRKR